jgi:hypothetical protein
MVPPAQLTHGKAAEMQRRAVVHFHALIRLDGVHPTDPDAVIAPPPGVDVDDIIEALHHAVRTVAFTTPPHPDRPQGWEIRWGDPDKGFDVQALTLAGDDRITDDLISEQIAAQKAGYLAKYTTKSTDAAGFSSTRLDTDPDTLSLYANPAGDHIARLLAACWRLGRPAADRQDSLDTKPASTTGRTTGWARLRRWAHRFGFGGHFLTKTRRRVVRFATLRETRVDYRRTQDQAADTQQGTVCVVDHLDAETTLIVGTLSFAGVGWHNTGDAMLANTAAALARSRHDTGREELAHDTGLGCLTGVAQQAA